MRLPPWVRRWTSLPIRNIPVRVRAGPNWERTWSLAVSGRGTIAGQYESERFEALASLVRPGEVFWDIGSHHGYATLIAARQIRSPGCIVSFEPSSSNRWYLSRHLEWNGEGNVRVMDCAVADSDRQDVFGGSGGSVTFHLGHKGESVEVRSITSLVQSGQPFPTFLKIDVEGAEGLVLEGAAPFLSDAMRRNALPTMIVSVHNEPLYLRCLELLKALGYRVLGSNRLSDFLGRADKWVGDPDLLAVPRQRHHELPRMRSIPWFTAGPEL
jgi:FkbM family methyltransferase